MEPPAALVAVVLLGVAPIALCSRSSSPYRYASERPQITESIPNVTVPLNRDAVLPCVVYSLGNHKVGWVNLTNQTVLTVEKRVITENSRVSLTHDEHGVWSLHIKKVKQTDRGCYMCQINTKPLTQRVGCLDVQIPPSILDNETTTDVAIQEGSDVTLHCSVRGYPQPRVTWRKEGHPDVVMYILRRKIELSSWHGEDLPLTSVTRHQIGSYMCIASNDVPPAVTKRMKLDVYFAPQVTISYALRAQENRITLNCLVQAHPPPRVHWTFVNPDGIPFPLVLNSSSWTILESRYSFYTNVSLHVNASATYQHGTYTCVAMNLISQAEDKVQLSEILAPLSSLPSRRPPGRGRPAQTTFFPADVTSEDPEEADFRVYLFSRATLGSSKGQELRDDSRSQVKRSDAGSLLACLMLVALS